MDFKNISKLLPEFLEMFKGNKGGLQDIASSLGNTGMLKKFLENSGKYTKYLPLLPVLAQLNEDGFKGLLNNSDNVSKILSVFNNSQNNNGDGNILDKLDISSLVKYLPLLSGLFKDKKTDTKSETITENDFENNLPAVIPDYKTNAKALNPLYYIADIADKEIIYALNKYISNNIDL